MGGVGERCAVGLDTAGGGGVGVLVGAGRAVVVGVGVKVGSGGSVDSARGVGVIGVGVAPGLTLHAPADSTSSKAPAVRAAALR